MDEVLERTVCVVTKFLGVYTVSNSIVASSFALCPTRNDNEFSMVAGSFIGRKGVLQDYLRQLTKGETIYLQKPGRKTDAYSKWEYYRVTLDRKQDEPVLSQIRPLTGSLFCQALITTDRIRPSAIHGDSDSFYMLGETLEQARGRFGDFLSQMPVPIHESWNDALWGAMYAKGWIQELTCFRAGGYVVQFEKEDLVALIREMWRDLRLDRTFLTGEPMLPFGEAA